MKTRALAIPHLSKRDPNQDKNNRRPTIPRTRIAAPYPVELEPIRRHCQMAGNAGPPYLGPDHRRPARHPRTPAPPTATSIVAVLSLTPGDFIRDRD